MKKKVAKKASGKVPMKTVGKTTEGVTNYGPGYKGPPLSMKKGGSVKSKK